jgi:phage portal protein BeeE
LTGWSLVLAHRADYTPKPFVDESGALVHPCAYQQILKGYPAVDYAARDLIYAPRNLRPGRVYGFSPVEQIVMTANIALKRQIFTLTHFTEGNIPESLIGVPETWTPDQIKNFQDYWDAYFTGDLATRRRAKFVPGGVAKTFIQTKEPELKNLFDEWLARVVCYVFSVSPQAFVHRLNL